MDNIVWSRPLGNIANDEGSVIEALSNSIFVCEDPYLMGAYPMVS